MQPDSEAAAVRRLIEVTRTITTGVLDLDQLLQKILNESAQVLGAERGYLILLDPDEAQPIEQRLRIKATYKLDRDEMLADQFRASRTAILKTLGSGEVHAADNALAENNPSRSVELYGLRSILCEPLSSKERLLGVLYLDSRVTNRFAPWAREIMPSLAAQAAICIENASLVAEREEALRKQHAERLHAAEMETWKNALAAFLSIASHDLKGPLSVLKNGVWSLERAVRDEGSKEVLADMRVSIQKAVRLVETYLDASLLHEGQDLQMNVAEVIIRPLVEGELQQVAAHLGDRLEEFELRNSVPEGLTGKADSHRLQQILGNLIGNAVKYSRKGLVEVWGARQKKWVVLEVRDQGPGISPAAQKRLFDRYYRVEPGSGQGTGLGLWIVRHLVESQGGSIEVESRPGTGSTFRFRLPA